MSANSVDATTMLDGSQRLSQQLAPSLSHHDTLGDPAARHVARRNIAREPKGQIKDFLDLNLNKARRATQSEIRQLETRILELKEYMAYLQRVGTAAGITMENVHDE